MKTEHRVTAPHGGLVAELLVAEGQEVQAGAALVVLQRPEAGDG
jgi:biotin carboxyl carrier protein